MSFTSVQTRMEAWIKRGANFVHPRGFTELDFENIVILSYLVFFLLFIPSFLFEVMIGSYGYSILFATIVCCWFVVRVCRSMHLKGRDLGAVLKTVLVVLRFFVVVFCAGAILNLVLGAMFEREKVVFVVAIPLLIAAIGFMSIKAGAADETDVSVE